MTALVVHLTDEGFMVGHSMIAELLSELASLITAGAVGPLGFEATIAPALCASGITTSTLTDWPGSVRGSSGSCVSIGSC